MTSTAHWWIPGLHYWLRMILHGPVTTFHVPQIRNIDLVGLPLRETMLRLAPDQDPDPLAETYSIAYKAAAAEKETLFEGVHSLLSGSYRAAVATGKSQYGADRTVARHDLTERFEVVLGANCPLAQTISRHAS